jgi:hypothetical protein
LSYLRLLLFVAYFVAQIDANVSEGVGPL